MRQWRRSGPIENLNSLVDQNFEVLDVVLQQMSQNEHFRSDLRQSSPGDAPNHAHNEKPKVTLTMPVVPGTSQLNCRAEQNYAMNTVRENAIASLIVFANIVPVH